MASAYEKIVTDNLNKLYDQPTADLEDWLPAVHKDKVYFFEADDDFPASVTTLFSNNANRFLPMDALADVGECSSKRILELL